MAYGLNKVMLIGHLGSDPEMRMTGSGVAVTSFSLATNESYKDTNGNMVDRTEWHRIVAWRRTAEVLNEYLKKGSKVYIEGKLQTRNYDDKEGVKRYTTEIVVDTFMFLDSKGGEGGGRQSSSYSSQGPEEPPPQQQESDLPF